MVFVIGEEGVGKSHLMSAVSDRALAMGLSVSSGRGSPIGPLARFRPIAEAISSLCRAGDRPHSEMLAPYQGVLGHLVPDFAAATRPDDAPSAFAIGEAVLRLAAAAGSADGCLVVFEDVQHADQGTAAVLEYLADHLSDQPIVMITTLRPEAGEILDVARAAAQRGRAAIMQLGRLGKEEVREFAATHLRVPAPEVSDRVVDPLFRDSDGNPLMIVELLREMFRQGLIAPGHGDLLLAGELAVVPRAIVRGISHHAARLGPHGLTLFRAAALFGHRFSATAVQAVTGLGDDDLCAHLDSGTVSGFLNQPAPDWYTFSQPLAARALIQQLTPAQRHQLARRAAAAMTASHPGLPGDWCEYVAGLLLKAGDDAGAARLFARAGARALRAGTPGPAAVLLEKALDVLADGTDPSLRAEILTTLLAALTENGQVNRALELEMTLVTTGLDRTRMAALHVCLGWAAAAAGRWLLGGSHLRAARRMLGSDAAEELSAKADALAAHLAVSELRQTGALGEERTLSRRDCEERAADLAWRAMARADTAGLAAVSCQAWLTLAAFSRDHGSSFTASCFERAHMLAVEHRLPLRRLRAAAGLAFGEWLAAADPTRLEHVRWEAHRLGAVSVCGEIDMRLALTRVLGGRHAEAAKLIEHRSAEAARLELAETARHMALAGAMLAAHQGRRRDMNGALARFRLLGGDQTDLLPLELGLVRAFCSLTEEDIERARGELAQAAVSGPACYPLVGAHGLELLLGVVSGSAGWHDHNEVVADPAAGLRWNRQFTTFARAVLLGRDARGEQAAAVLTEAERLAAPFPLARYLGLRLVAEAAVIGRWGNPAGWLRRAEEYFHHAGVSASASACRALLRRTGECVSQRRRGDDAVPRALRLLGVTLREFEVLLLLAELPGNIAIAERLHISPRTVEKHVANLRIKCEQRDRAALCRFAAGL